ncbi:hypothetical protein GCM10023237_64800 [Streptomyces coeruleoprunus]
MILLVGYLLTAAALVVALALAGVLALSERVDGAGLKALGLATLVGLAVLLSLGRAVLCAVPVPPGAAVDRAGAPELWRLVEDCCAALDCRTPHEVLLVPEANAYMQEDGWLLGLLAGRRRLYVGAGLLTGLTVDQLRFVLAHELGHHARGDGRLGALTYAGWDAVENAAQGAGVPWGVVLRGYHWAYRLASLGVLRYQEHTADRNAARMTGTRVAVDAVRSADALERDWSRFLRTYADVTVDGVALTGVTEAFALFSRDQASGPSPAGGGPAPGSKAASRWDTHPSPRERIEIIEAMGSLPPATAADDRPAHVLVPLLERHGPKLDALALRAVGTSGTAFPDHAVRVARARAQRCADVLYRAAARAYGAPDAGLSEVLDLLADGRAADLAAQLKRARISTDRVRNTAFELAAHLTAALSATAERAGAAVWAYTPGIGPALTAPDGLLDAVAWADAALASPGGAADVRARLRKRGICLEEAGGSFGDVRISEAEAEVMGAMMLRFNGGVYDLVVEASAVNFLPVRVHDVRWWTRSERLAHRLRQVAAGGPVPEGRFRVSLDDVVEATLTHPVRANAELRLKDGTALFFVDAGPGRVAGPRRPSGGDSGRDFGGDSGRDFGREHVAATRAALRRWVDDVSRAATYSAPEAAGPQPVAPPERLAALEETRRGMGKVDYAKLMFWTVVPPPVAAVVNGHLAGNHGEGYGVAFVLGLPALAVLLIRWRGVRQRHGRGRRKAVARRAARQSSMDAGLRPVRWGVLGIVLSLLCPPMCVVGLIYGIRSVVEARMAGTSVVLGVLAILAAPASVIELLLLF